MDLIGSLILITIAIVLYEIFIVLLSMFYFFIVVPIGGQNGIVLDKNPSLGFKGILDMIAAYLIPILIFILLFYTFMYIIYLFIIYVIPPTGPATLFIPIKEMALQVYPLPQLIEYGVFRLYDRILGLFGFKGSIIAFVITFGSILFDFSRENIKRVLIFIFPGLEKEINEYDNKIGKTEKSEELQEISINKKEEDIRRQIAYKQINDAKEICIAQNTIIITPEMSSKEKMAANMKNNQEKINCESKSIGNYLKVNY